MKIIIIGSNGMLGRYVYTYFKNKSIEVYGLTRKEMDCRMSTEEIEGVLTKIISGNKNNSTVINCSGIINRRKVSNSEFYKVNSLFPYTMYSICQKLGINFIHVSTDCVYNGKLGNYNEYSKHSSRDLYGMSKSLGEGDHMTIRTSLIGEEIYNKYSLIEWLKRMNNQTITGYINHYWNGMTCLEFSKLLEYLIDRGIYWTGTRNFFSPRIITKYELCTFISKTYNLNLNIERGEAKDYIDRSLTSIHSQTYVVKDIETQLIELSSFSTILSEKEDIGNCQPRDKNTSINISTTPSVNNGKNLFIVTSCINPIDKKLNRDITRSVFDRKQRLLQTLNTLESIKSRGGTILLVEGSSLTNEEEKILKENVHLYINLSQNPIYRVMIDGNNKSIGETCTLYFSLQYILSSSLEFDTISKISGRYYLDEKYSIQSDRDCIIYRKFSNNDYSWYSSVLYTYGWNKRYKMLNMLVESMFLMLNGQSPDIELSMYYILNTDSSVKVYEKDIIGVSGWMSVNGESVSH